MKLLALDTATDACSAALFMDGAVRERFELAPRRHTALLLPMADALMAEAGISAGQLDFLAYSQGPGSFTGLRIAIGAVQGLALGLDRPVIGVSTLAALAARCQRLHGAEQVAVALDARMNQVYWGAYGQDAEGRCSPRVNDGLYDPVAIPRLAAGAWMAAGSGWLKYGEALTRASGLRPERPGLERYPHAEDIARLAADRARRGEGRPGTQAQPNYLREQVAEKSRS